MNQDWNVHTSIAGHETCLQNRYRCVISPCRTPNGDLGSDFTPTSHSIIKIPDEITYQPSPIIASNHSDFFNNRTVFSSCDLVFDYTADPSPFPCYRRSLYSKDTGNQNRRVAAFERLITKFPHLRHMLETEEVMAENSVPYIERLAYSTPTFYTHLQLPPINFTSNIATSVMDEETDIGYNSLSDTYSTTPSLSSYELDCPFESNVSTTENKPVTDLQNNCTSQQQPIPDLYELLTCVKVEPDSTCALSEKPYVLKESKCLLAEKKKYPCTLCSKTYVTRSNLTVHMRGHRGERPHTCYHCGKGFTQKSGLRTHIRTHTGERPYRCSICPNAFSDFSTYTKHNRIHTGERPYACGLCGKRFTQSGNMIRHRQTHQKSENISNADVSIQ